MLLITTVNLFSKEHSSCSLKHPSACIKAEEISEFSERFSALGSGQALIFSFFTLQYRLGLCELSKTPHVCFQSLSSPYIKTFPYLSSVKSHFSVSLYFRETKPRHARTQANPTSIRNKSAISKLHATVQTD